MITAKMVTWNTCFVLFFLGQLLQVVRAANGAQYIFQPQQSVVLQQQVIPQMQPGGVQAPVIQQVKKNFGCELLRVLFSSSVWVTWVVLLFFSFVL